MKNVIFILVFVFFYGQLMAQSNKLLFKTTEGNFKVLLYDYTPKHKQLMLQAIKDSVYKDVLFNRIIKNFVVQGGEHDDVIAEYEKELSKDERRRLLPEFNKRAFHKLGALGAGRDENEDKASFLTQIYFVVGKPVSKNELNTLEKIKGKKFTRKQRKTYLLIGGQPRLDGDYTVFGEVYEGLNVLLEISKAQTNNNNYPLKDISFEIIELLE